MIVEIYTNLSFSKLEKLGCNQSDNGVKGGKREHDAKVTPTRTERDIKSGVELVADRVGAIKT
jgi:hypothetical protein